MEADVDEQPLPVELHDETAFEQAAKVSHTERTEEVLISSRERDVRETYTCEYCKQSFHVRVQYSEHLRVAHPIECRTCTICDRVLISRKAFLRHNSKVHPLKQFACKEPSCTQVFPKSFQALEHYRTAHTNIRFKCTHCDKSFLYEYKLKAHVTKAHNEGNSSVKISVCDYCGMPCGSRMQLVAHLNGEHRIEYTTCDVCQRQFDSREDMIVHRRTNHQRKDDAQYCEVCDVWVSSRANLVAHNNSSKHFGNLATAQDDVEMNVDPAETQFRMLCKTCDEEFTDRLAVKRHLVLPQHRVPKAEIDRRHHHSDKRHKLHVNESVQRGNACEEWAYACFDCDRVFSTAVKLYRHYMETQAHAKHSSKSIENTRTRFESEFPPPLRRKKPKQFSDTEEAIDFEDAFGAIDDLMTDKRRTRRGKRVPLMPKSERDVRETYRCDYCQETFRIRTKYSEHLRIVHPIDSRTCTLCNKVLISRKAYLRHNSKVHPSKLFPCKDPNCDKVFVRGKVQSVHSDEHFECDDCGKTFTYEYKLRKHKEKVHGQGTSNNMLECEYCGMTCEGRMQLAAHCNNDHRIEYTTCDVCQRQFDSREDMVVHRRVNHQRKNEKLYCEVCDQYLHNQGSLTVHNNTEKHFENLARVGSVDVEFKKRCERCNEEFTDRVALKQHLMRVQHRVPRVQLEQKHYTTDKRNKPQGSDLSEASTSRSDDESADWAYACFDCDRVFSSAVKLFRHYMETQAHSTVPLPCKEQRREELKNKTKRVSSDPPAQKRSNTSWELPVVVAHTNNTEATGVPPALIEPF